jgi:hypothetical protein
VQLSDLPDEQNLDAQFNLASIPNTPLRTRTGAYVLALRPVEFTANPIVSYPTSIQGTRTTPAEADPSGGCGEQSLRAGTGLDHFRRCLRSGIHPGQRGR